MVLWTNRTVSAAVRPISGTPLLSPKKTKICKAQKIRQKSKSFSLKFPFFENAAGKGLTILNRFHDKDPLFWKNGFQLVWRIGDRDDNANMKCHVINGGYIAGNPTASKVNAYAWYYTWPASAPHTQQVSF